MISASMAKILTLRIAFLVLVTVLAVSRNGSEANQDEQVQVPVLKVCALDNKNNADGECIHPVWQTGTLSEITNFLDCEWESKEGHQEEVWKTFNRVYNEVVGSERSTIPPKYESNGFQIPVEIKYSEVAGRGVFTKVPIAMGDLIYVSTNNALFHTVDEYRNFLRKLPTDLACDVLIWAFARMVSATKKDEFVVCVDLDEGSFVNSAPYQSHQCNMELGTETGLLEKEEDEETTWYGCEMKFYAKRDIAANEEIRADYDDFAEPQAWHEMGLN